MLIPNTFAIIMSVIFLTIGYFLAVFNYAFPALDTLYVYFVLLISIYNFIKINNIYSIKYLEAILVNLIVVTLVGLPFLWINSIHHFAYLYMILSSIGIFSTLWMCSKDAVIGVIGNSRLSRVFRLGKTKALQIRTLNDLKKINVLLYDSHSIDNKKDVQLILSAENLGIKIQDKKQAYEYIYGAQSSFELKPLNNLKKLQNNIYDFIKYGISRLIALFGLIITFPILVAIYSTILIFEGKSAIFKQDRLGQYNKKYTIYKFRTLPLNYNENYTGKITKLGYFLRHSKLDELPQLLNVILGNMTLIGPRPEMELIGSDPSKVPNEYYLRHVIKPGVTGWAQVNYKPSNSYLTRTRKLRYDLFYLNNRCFLLDVLILLRTVSFVFGSRKMGS